MVEGLGGSWVLVSKVRSRVPMVLTLCRALKTQLSVPLNLQVRPIVLKRTPPPPPPPKLLQKASAQNPEPQATNPKPFAELLRSSDVSGGTHRRVFVPKAFLDRKQDTPVTQGFVSSVP